MFPALRAHAAMGLRQPQAIAPTFRQFLIAPFSRGSASSKMDLNFVRFAGDANITFFDQKIYSLAQLGHRLHRRPAQSSPFSVTQNIPAITCAALRTRSSADNDVTSMKSNRAAKELAFLGTGNKFVKITRIRPDTLNIDFRILMLSEA